MPRAHGRAELPRNSLEKLEHEIEILQERQDPIEDLMRRLDLIPDTTTSRTSNG
jgi:predicted  nucleic acid-binding Zn-ribbon protein